MTLDTIALSFPVCIEKVREAGDYTAIIGVSSIDILQQSWTQDRAVDLVLCIAGVKDEVMLKLLCSIEYWVLVCCNIVGWISVAHWDMVRVWIKAGLCQLTCLVQCVSISKLVSQQIIVTTNGCVVMSMQHDTSQLCVPSSASDLTPLVLGSKHHVETLRDVTNTYIDFFPM